MFLRTLAVISMLAAISCGNRDSPAPPGTVEVIPLETLEPATGGTMVLVPGGEFTMGEKNGRADASAHVVQVNSFFIDRHPVTQELYEKILGANPSRRKDPASPVSGVYWTDAARFCNRSSELEGLTPCYDLETWTCDFEANGYRLPTEAEWEYACRAGSRTHYSFGNEPGELPRHAWSKPHSRGRTHPVGEKPPNRWGLHDMHGNVWEWCNDWYDETYYRDSPRRNPRGPASGKQRVLRGGAWNSPADRCRSAYRAREFPVFQDACFGVDSYGFRRVRRAGVANPVEPADVAGTEGPVPVSPPRADPAPAPAPDPVVAPHRVTGSGKIDPGRLRGTIVFVSDRSGDLDIWKMHASGKNPTPLTRDAHPDADPRFSPDGTTILYTTLRDGFPRLRSMNRDGSDGREITGGAQAAWSPGGRSIVFVRDGQAWIRDLRSGRERRLTPESWVRCGTPAWSRDGQQIAVASRHEGDVAIYLLDPAGRRVSRLVTEESSCTPDWSHDGKKLIFQTDRGRIHEIGLDGRNEEPLTFGADVQHEGRYAPGGSMAVFCRAPTPRGPWQICVLDLESDDLDFIQITRKGSNRQPDWHPLDEE